MIECR